MNRLVAGLILISVADYQGGRFIDRGKNAGEMALSTVEHSERVARAEIFKFQSLRGLSPLIILLAVGLSGCSEKPPQQAAAAAPPVTVAQPTKRTVTDWDEFTGRFEAVEEVQVRARVGGFVTSVEFRDGAFVKTGDLLYVIDARPFEAVAGRRRRSGCALKAGFGRRSASDRRDRRINPRRYRIHCRSALPTCGPQGLDPPAGRLKAAHSSAPTSWPDRGRSVASL